MVMERLILTLLLLAGISLSTVVRSEGEGCSSDIKEARREALRNAKLNAVERHIGVLISSKTLIVNSRLMRDIIQTRVMGTVKLVGKPSYGKPRIEGRDQDQVCVEVRAEFEIPAGSVKPADFGLVLMLSKKELKRGEELEIELSSEEPCFPYLFNVDAKGKVYRLLPNPVEGTLRLKGRLKFPTERMRSQGYRLMVISMERSKPQREEILFVCSKKKMKAFEDFFPSAFAEDEEELRKLLRTPYPKTVERFNEILTQIGAENYDMVDDFYVIY